MEEKNTFSNIQGGFRRDRPTFAKIWTLRNIIEHSIMNDKELHLCYIDIQKVYDSVEYWALDLILDTQNKTWMIAFSTKQKKLMKYM